MKAKNARSKSAILIKWQISLQKSRIQSTSSCFVLAAHPREVIFYLIVINIIEVISVANPINQDESLQLDDYMQLSQGFK